MSPLTTIILCFKFYLDTQPEILMIHDDFLLLWMYVCIVV